MSSTGCAAQSCTATSEGCAHGAACAECVIRNAVNEAFQEQTHSRRRIQMELTRSEEPREVHLWLTTAPFEGDGRQLVLLVLEDISELVTLQLAHHSHKRQLQEDQRR